MFSTTIAMSRYILMFSIMGHLVFAYAENSDQNTITTKAENTRTKIEYDFYSESYVASTYFNGSINQNRFRFLYPTLQNKVLPYLGVNTSHDLTASENLRFADDFISPTAGLLVKPVSFIGLFAEYRRLYRLTDNELPIEENDPRYGAYIYYLQKLPISATPHAEIYAESVALNRFTSKPVTTAWLKLGKEFLITSQSLSFTPYLEGLYRESPNLMVGFDERSLRFGGKLKWQTDTWSAQLLTYRRFQSSSVPNGWEAFLVLSANGGFHLWN